MAKKSTTPSFLLEVPLRVTAQQARHLRAHLEAARCFYNAVLGETCQRLRHMRADPAWEQARTLPRHQKHARKQAFAALREQSRSIVMAATPITRSRSPSAGISAPAGLARCSGTCFGRLSGTQ